MKEVSSTGATYIPLKITSDSRSEIPREQEVGFVVKSGKSWNQEMLPNPTVLSLVKKPRVTHTKVTLCLSKRHTSSMGKHRHTVSVFSVNLHILPHFRESMRLVLATLDHVPPQEHLSPIPFLNTLSCFHLASRSFQLDPLIQKVEIPASLALFTFRIVTTPMMLPWSPPCQVIPPSLPLLFSLFHFEILWKSNTASHLLSILQ